MHYLVQWFPTPRWKIEEQSPSSPLSALFFFVSPVFLSSTLPTALRFPIFDSYHF